nr:hypothetical protein [Kibdelosporangium sp. MJ126-NF4]
MTVGSAVTFVVAAVAGVLGNQLTKDAVWAWVAFGAALVVGAAVTALVAYRNTPAPSPTVDSEPEQTDDAPAADTASTRPRATKPLAQTIEGPVAQGDVHLKGTYVAGHDITFTGTEGARGKKRP